MTIRDTLNARKERCPTCGAFRNGSWTRDITVGRLTPYNSNGRVRIRPARLVIRYRRPPAFLPETPTVRPVRKSKMTVRPSKGNSNRWISKTTIRCIDPWHSTNTVSGPCSLECRKHTGVPHYHEDGPGRALCDGECFNHRFDPEDSYSYESEDGYDEPHWHDHTALPRLHKTDEERRAKRLAKRRRSDKRRR